MGNIAIIIQGPSNFVNEQRESWKDLSNDVIFSTWKGSEHLYNKSENVIFSDNPVSSPMNFLHQVKSTYEGLLKVKDLGYKFALKIRSDIIPTNSIKFLTLLDETSFNFLAWQNHEFYPKCNGYLVDYLMSGYIDDMIKFWDIKNCLTIVPEINLTDNFIKNIPFFKNKTVKYFLDNLSIDNNLFWIKRNFYLSECQEYYKAHGGFTNDIKFLNNDYLNFLNI
jgi:hypothetical protein